MNLVVGIANMASIGSGSESSDAKVSAEVVARCRACRREARIAWHDARPSMQELRLDVLYGRR